ncbi:hypothetical protein [Rhizobium oryziradicis]|nr:hypothetical protein [Rhizobium oryziradicis]
MRWIIHIGAPKTGSTAIQRFLFENRAMLIEHGILYPEVSIRGFGHHDLAFLLHGQYAKWATPQDRSLTDLRDILRGIVLPSAATTILLSSENFYVYPKPSALRSLLVEAGLHSSDEIVIVCYVRRQDDAHVSWYNQSVKAQGNTSSLNTTIIREHGLWDYATRLQPWADEFGINSILVRDYTPFSQRTADIRDDFLAILGADRDRFHLPAGRENERVNRDILAFQRWVNHLPLSAKKKRRYHKQLIELTAASEGAQFFDDTPLLSLAARETLLASYAASNAVLAKMYLKQETIFDPLEEKDIAAGTALSGLTIRKIFRILAWIAGFRNSFQTIPR